MSKIDLSVVLPCYNEAAILEKNVNIIMKVLDKARLSYEIIITEDGSKDGTDIIAKRLSKENDKIQFFHFHKRLGRGRAVANGFKKARGEVVGFIDLDLQTPPEYIVKCYNEIKKGADGVEPIRYYREEYHFFFIRLVLSIAYRSLFKRMFKIKLEDTLAGCKFFKRDKILPILSKVKDNHWFWDTEIMVIAYYEGLELKEIPSVFLNIEYKNRKSKASVITSTFDLFFDLLELRKRVKRIYRKR
jgi:glycosyltransferase AglD